MSNTNFQTFHQMGQAINEVVRQATGRDNVQNIDMEHITVAQNHYYQDVDVSGRVVSFHAGAAGLPLEKCVVQIEPVQDLHGYDHPWPGGGGKNLWSEGDKTFTRYIACTLAHPVPAGTYTFSAIVSTTDTDSDYCRVAFYDSDGLQIFNKGITRSTTRTSILITLERDCYAIYLYAASTANQSDGDTATFADIQLESGSTATDYSPYENICPITGWTGAQVYVSPTTDAADGQTYSIAFPAEAGTVYGGTLDAVSGELVVDMKKKTYNGSENWVKYPSFNGYMLNESEMKNGIRQNGFSNMLKDSKSTTTGQKNCMWLGVNTQYIYIIGVYETMGITLADFKNYLANHNLEIVFPLATPITYQLTPTEITTLLGVNNIWSDAGDIEVKFKDLKELY